jgi:RNA polymerase sigma-70 factor, ECF subfamily
VPVLVRIAFTVRAREIRGKMPAVPAALVAPRSGEEDIGLVAKGSTESIAVPLVRSRAIARPTAGDRRRERRWIKAAQAGSEAALEQLYRRHWPWAHRAAYLVVHDAAAAEDIAQEAFLAAVRALDRFDRRRPFGPWLNRIVVNRAIDWARARALRRESAADLDLEPGRFDSPAATGPYSDATMTALAALTPDQRAVVVLRYLLEHTPGEIAAMLELPRGTVNSRLRRALDRLEEELEGEHP